MKARTIKQYLEHVTSVDAPFVTCSDSSILSLIEENVRPLFDDGEFFHLDAKDLKKWNEFSDAAANKFRFPNYYGGNWNAFLDLMRDLEWLDFSKVFFLVTNSDDLFAGSQDQIRTFVKQMRLTSDYWKTPYRNETIWDHDAISFHTLLLASKNHVRFGCPYLKLQS